eukprot:gnl/TRDRNA2_/TRDRNA2_169996_c1_seq1.p2 gnl/TRDRNA2_/TRDRNA2_169996_c1~~gnl/TRDRNA2_/TRDRNA2_169996_c1_seq1.p2  ORF type:complete len:110 (+),score=28.04 gnl/TRDRNA2_/TRDRNA2_169996_c1_seq1:110-439(+)
MAGDSGRCRVRYVVALIAGFGLQALLLLQSLQMQWQTSALLADEKEQREALEMQLTAAGRRELETDRHIEGLEDEIRTTKDKLRAAMGKLRECCQLGSDLREKADPRVS